MVMSAARLVKSAARQHLVDICIVDLPTKFIGLDASYFSNLPNRQTGYSKDRHMDDNKLAHARRRVKVNWKEPQTNVIHNRQQKSLPYVDNRIRSQQTECRSTGSLVQSTTNSLRSRLQSFNWKITVSDVMTSCDRLQRWRKRQVEHLENVQEAGLSILARNPSFPVSKTAYYRMATEWYMPESNSSNNNERKSCSLKCIAERNWKQDPIIVSETLDLNASRNAFMQLTSSTRLQKQKKRCTKGLSTPQFSKTSCSK
jgi:hypothetical protein